MIENHELILEAMKTEYFKRAAQEDKARDRGFTQALDLLQEAIKFLQEESNRENTISKTTGVGQLPS
jgi:hypothetical protein